MLELDRRGIAGVAVFSSEFADAIGAWKRVHGYDAGAVLVQHPIQPRTDDEMRGLADIAVAHIVETLDGG